MSNLDPRAKPPEAVRAVYKRYQRLDGNSLLEQSDLIDMSKSPPGLAPSPLQLSEELETIFRDYLGQSRAEAGDMPDPRIYEIQKLPGLHIYPSLLPPSVQRHLLHTLLLRDLNNPQHKTNVHTHYSIPYPTSTFFDTQFPLAQFQPRDPTLHKPFTTPQFLNRKLRWMTLGGQYDWTNKVYPEGPPPPFPPDSKKLVENLFPMKAEAAIVNLYTPGDTLSLHRDVSEECNRPLASISIGCDAIFVVGVAGEEGEDEGARMATIRLRSGDALLMSGTSRYAWHGVPKILEGTCPEWLHDWPYGVDDGGKECYKDWQGWMSRKRINLNVRQMFAYET